MDIFVYVILATVVMLLSKGAYDKDRPPEAAEAVIGLLKDLKSSELLLEEGEGFTEEDVMKEFDLFFPDDIESEYDFDEGGDELYGKI